MCKNYSREPSENTGKDKTYFKDKTYVTVFFTNGGIEHQMNTVCV